KDFSVRIFQPATASTSRLTAARLGAISVSATHSRSGPYWSIQKIQTSSTSPHSAIHTAQTKNGESFGRRTAARLGKRCSIKTRTRARLHSLSIRRTRKSSTLTCGPHDKAHGKTAPGKDLVAASIKQRTAAI